MSSVDCILYTSGIETHSFSVSSPFGENSAFTHFAAAIAKYCNLAFPISLDTHHCWVGRSTSINITYHENRVPDLLIWSNTLSTRPDAPIILCRLGLKAAPLYQPI